VLRAVVLTQYRRVTDRQTDRQTDGQRRTDGRNCIASTELAMGALRRAVKIGRSTDGGGSGLKFFKIILTWNHGFNHNGK